MENIKQYKGDYKTEVIEASKIRPVIVDFHASWCGPCKQLAPLLEKAAKEGKFTLLQIDIDTYEQDANDNDVSSIPYVVLYIDGVKKNDFHGFDTSALQKMLDMCK